jgi:signal transduction histidine kinase
MFSKIANTQKPFARSAAWRISLWGTLAFACGTLVVFMVLNNFVAHDIERRTDAWLTGEVQTLGDVASRTPRDHVYSRVVREVAELATREVPNRDGTSIGYNDSVFFMQTSSGGEPMLWVGRGDGHNALNAIRAGKFFIDTPFHLNVEGFHIPFRVISVPLPDGSHIFLAVSERDQIHVLYNLRLRFLFLWLLNVALGFAIVFCIARRMLTDVREITEAASLIGESDLSQRVPTSGRRDEVDQLASTLNNMLDRIERSIRQLHTITNSLAHDLRSPLTAIRAKLEISLGANVQEHDDCIVSAIDEVDRLTEILTKSLDVAEAQVDALRLNRTVIDFDELLRTMIDLYEPTLFERGLQFRFISAGSIYVFADASLIHRMMANLFDNELKHLPASCIVSISLSTQKNFAVIIIEDDGPGFSAEVRSTMFDSRAKRSDSPGYGLGLAFVKAVATVHGGIVTADNGDEGGIKLTITFPLQKSPVALNECYSLESIAT